MGEEGSSLVEFAMVVPLMLTVLTGGASFSMALYNMQQLSNATAATTQQLGAQGKAVTGGDPCAAAVTSVTAMLPHWTASKLTYTLTITTSGGTYTSGPTTGSSFSCTSLDADMDANAPLTLTVTYSYTWFPILGFSPSSNLTASESALIE
jgi:Flp pilus assembly protein TadG